MPSKRAIALVAIIFLLTLLVRLPAGILSLLLPRNIQCQEPGGTLWQGSCAQLHAGTLALSDLQWALHPLALLRARAQLDVQSGDPRATGNATVTVSPGGDADVDALAAIVPLQGGLSPLPADWSGQLELAIAHASLQSHQLTSIQGTITARDLHVGHPAMELGGFELSFPPTAPGAPIVGTLRDTGGPLSVQGTLQLAHGGYELNALLGARDAGNADLQKLLQMLGPPNPQGRHTLSLAGSF
jgi:hypothetical protein